MKLKRNIYKILFKYLYRIWNIAIADIDENLNPINIKWLKHDYKDRWFADPFIVHENPNECIVLVEEFMINSLKGRIAQLTINRKNGVLINNKTILDVDSHLSFPNNIKINNEKILYPENSRSGILAYYVYTKKDIIRRGIISNNPLTDAIIFPNNGYWYLMATVGNNCNKNILHVYKSDLPLKNYKFDQEIIFKDNIARRAGNVFMRNGKIYSPAQVCINDYGEAVSIQELIFEDNKIKLNELKRILPLSNKYKHGFHTYNVFNNILAIDGYYYPFPLLWHFYKKIRGIDI